MGRKSSFWKRFLGIILTVSILFPSAVYTVQANGRNAGGSTEVRGQLAPLNTAYLQYIENGGGAVMPSSLDLSYLWDSYQSLLMRRNALLPSSYDLRDYGKVGPVEDQGSYGTCWAFAALGSAESALVEQFPFISFSKLHLAWFAVTGAEEEEYFSMQAGSEYDPYNMGGSDTKAVSALAAWKGPVLSEKMPYDTQKADETLRREADYHLQDAFYLSYGSYGYNEPETPIAGANIIKQVLMDYGAVSVSYTGSDAQAAAQGYYNPDTFAVYHDEFQYADHAVLIVGWDDDFSRENFKEGCRPETDGAWLIRNSWGTGWGDDGYFWLSYADATIEFGPYYHLEAAGNYARNYQYDTTGWGISASADDFLYTKDASKQAFISNIFTAESAEQLEAVSFYTTDAGTQYEISVYTGVEEGKPTSGVLAYSGQTGMEPYAGYHTIELHSAVALRRGERFSVVVRLTNPAYAYPMALEFCLLPYEKEKPEYLGAGGESYYSADGVTWTDVTALSAKGWNLTGGLLAHAYTTNVCLKAFTNPLPAEGAAVGNVDFSLMEGPVALGSKLELTGAEEIHYQITPAGGKAENARRYIQPIEITESCTVTAWGEKDEKKGNSVSKTYEQAASALTELAVMQDGGNIFCNLSGGQTEFSLTMANASQSVRIRPRGADRITADGIPIASDAWSEPIAIRPGETKRVTITSSADGKQPTTYTVNIYRSALTYDYTKETVFYDENQYTLKDADSTVIPSGSSVQTYIVEKGNEDVILFLLKKDTNEVLTETVPKRLVAIVSPVDFENERTIYAYGDTNEISYNADMSDSFRINGYIHVEPGKDIYIRKPAAAAGFASRIVKIEIPPARPPAPQQVEVTAEDTDSITLTALENGRYRIKAAQDGEWSEWSEWQTGNSFAGLALGSAYTIEARIGATETEFASESVRLEARTADGALFSVLYRYDGRTMIEIAAGATEGTHVILADAELLAEEGYALKENTEAAATVAVSLRDGILTADPAQVVFEIVPTEPPENYCCQVTYWDISGKRLDTMEYAFDVPGVVTAGDIPLPDGYQLVNSIENTDIVAELFYTDGRWFVLGKEVHLVIEKMAAVRVRFLLEDGTELTASAQELYFGEIGSQTVTVEAPDGYTLAGQTAYTVKISRDGDNALTADPAEILVMLKAPHTHSFGEWTDGGDGETHRRTCTCGETETQAHHWDAGKTTKQPSQTEAGERRYTCTVCGAVETETIPAIGENPQTGDGGAAPWMVMMLISSSALVLLTVGYRRRKTPSEK